MRRRLTPDMNVTPLVDVVLVLLIIFMVVTPQLEAGAAVELPAARNPDAANEGKLDALTVSLTAAGGLFLERERVTKPVLLERLVAAHRQLPEQRLVLKADKRARYADARALFKACQDVGFPGVQLQVAEKQRP